MILAREILIQKTLTGNLTVPDESLAGAPSWICRSGGVSDDGMSLGSGFGLFLLLVDITATAC